jgi:membrane fusion protein (multidrug efflux system)
MTTSETVPDIKTASAPRRNKHRVGRFLLISGPLLVGLLCAYLYLTDGRYVKTNNAYIQADKVAISCQVSGTIMTIKVAENSHVLEGQPLFIIDNRSYVIAVEQARARLQSVKAEIAALKASYHQQQTELRLAQLNIEFAERKYHRQSNLDKFKAVAEAILDNARHNLEISRQKAGIVQNGMEQILAQLDGDPDAKLEHQANYRLALAEVENAELNLARTTVLAPFAGRVSKIPTAGQYVKTGQAVMSLIGDTAFWVEANFKETDLTHMQPGQIAFIEIASYPDRKWQGTVISISPGTGSEYSIIPAQNASGNWVKVVQRVPVRIAVQSESTDPNLLAGLSSFVRIDTGYHRPLPSPLRTVLNAMGFGNHAWAK